MFGISYARVETALVATYRVRERDRRAFRARLTFWQRNGVLGVSPGKGTALTYTPDLMYRLLFGIEIAECGASPAMVVGTITDLWEKKIRRGFDEAEQARRASPESVSQDDIIVELGRISMMIGGWRSIADAVPNVNFTSLRKVAYHAVMWMDEPNPDEPPRTITFNLTERLRRFHHALAATSEHPQPRKAGKRKGK